MADIWFLGDTHFFQQKILEFTVCSGGPRIRPDFKNLGEMHEKIVTEHNAVVKPGDKFYHMGDVTFDYGKEFYKLWYSLNGRKRLIPGNHDDLTNPKFCALFEKIYVMRTFGNKQGGFVCTHMPMRRTSFPMSTVLNLHGHIHEKTVRMVGPGGPPDLAYMNTSCEVLNYRPVHIEEVKARVKFLKEPAK